MNPDRLFRQYDLEALTVSPRGEKHVVEESDASEVLKFFAVTKPIMLWVFVAMYPGPSTMLPT